MEAYKTFFILAQNIHYIHLLKTRFARNEARLVWLMCVCLLQKCVGKPTFVPTVCDVSTLVSTLVFGTT